MGWFEINKEGLRQLLNDKSKAFVLRELIQNAWDEPSVTKCTVTIESSGRRANIVVEDDAPEGFYDLSHAYTLFAHTRKRAEPEQRGRFNLGEKQVLSLCDEARITTTKGTVCFLSNGERKNSKEKTEKGSRIFLSLKMKKSDAIHDVADKRWGDRRCVASPGCAHAKESALIRGYHLVAPAEMSSAEWDNLKKAKAIPSSTELFPEEFVDATGISELTEEHRHIEKLVKNISILVLGFAVISGFILSPKSNTIASYRDRHIRFNMSFINHWNDQKLIELIIHELGHEYGGHLEKSYQEALCRIGATLALMPTKEIVN